MCIDAAEGLKLQCGREYGFSSDEARATQLHKLTESQLQGLPTNNLVTETDLSKFSRLAEVAKLRNKNFKAKGIRNDMTLYQSNKGEVQNLARKIRKVLQQREIEWNDNQKTLQKARIEQKLALAGKRKDYGMKLLQNCKTWGGPCTTQEELELVLENRSDMQEKIVKVELTYYKYTHKPDVIARPDLYHLNKISHEERLENLLVILTDTVIQTGCSQYH